MLDFMTYCYEQGLGARTVYDKVVTVLQLFKKHGRSGLMEKGDWPNYVDTIRPVYEPEELVAMFRAATDDEATLLKFVLGSGFRDQEIRYVEWKDIDFRNHDCPTQGETALALHSEKLGGARSTAPIRFDRAAEKAERGAQGNAEPACLPQRSR